MQRFSAASEMSEGNACPADDLQSSATILLVTVGTLGDLHPFIAMALALKARGARPLMAVADDQVTKCLAAGVEAEAVMPGVAAACGAIDRDQSAAVHRLMSNQREMLKRVLLPALDASVTSLDALVARIAPSAIIASTFAFGASFVSEKRGLPLMSVVLQPMAQLSAFDPPATPDFRIMVRRPSGRLGFYWNRLVYASLREAVHWRYGRRIDRVRRDYGLPASGARHLFDPPLRSVARLSAYSRQLGMLPDDAHPTTSIVGFPVFDSDDGREAAMPELLEAFLRAGPPPIVFTLGSFAVHAAGRFYDRARSAAAALDRRALLLVGGCGAPRWNGDVFVCSYAPHSLVFPHAAVIVHHGGVGTTGQAMRAGKPQLVVPHMGDQHDHAARIVRLGLGRKLAAARFTVSRAVRELVPLLANPDYATRAKLVAAAMQDEHGAAAAADTVLRLLRSSANATTS